MTGPKAFLLVEMRLRLELQMQSLGIALSLEVSFEKSEKILEYSLPSQRYGVMSVVF
jgi:hypothetical protein